MFWVIPIILAIMTFAMWPHLIRIAIWLDARHSPVESEMGTIIDIGHTIHLPVDPTSSSPFDSPGMSRLEEYDPAHDAWDCIVRLGDGLTGKIDIYYEMAKDLRNGDVVEVTFQRCRHLHHIRVLTIKKS